MRDFKKIRTIMFFDVHREKKKWRIEEEDNN